MTTIQLRTKTLTLVAQTREEARGLVENLPAPERAAVSPGWLALLDASGPVDPWIHGFRMVHAATGEVVGHCGFKGPPAEGMVEIAYGVNPAHQGKGYATEAAEALVSYAWGDPRVTLVRAHTAPETNASGRVLTKAGFRCLGEVTEPEDGLVWRWEKRREAG